MNIDDLKPYKNIQKKYIDLLNSGYCLMLLYTYVDFTLEQKIEELSTEQLYSCIIQIVYIICIIRKEGFIHYDFGPSNVGLRKTTKKYIEILGNKISTFGYICVALDYGKIYSEKFIYTPEEEKEHENMDAQPTDTFSLRFISFQEKKLHKNDIEFLNNNIDSNSLGNIIEFFGRKI
jgi:hypothetical protein